MSEGELREGLRAAVGDEPPLRFDPDELIRRGRHERKRRRALVAVGVATLALTGTVLSLPGLLGLRSGDGPPGFDAAAPPVLTTTVAPPVLTTTAAPPVDTTPEPTSSPRGIADAKLLGAYASQRLLTIAPEVKVLRAEFTEPGARDRSGHVTGFVQFVDREGVTRVTAQLSAPSMRVTRERFCAGATCSEPHRLNDGSHLESAAVVDPKGKLITHSVAHFRLDGSVVQVSAYNFDPVDGGGVRRTVSLDNDQLAKLATDPGLVAW
ncbi:hypothetical protein [Saccharothrix xinjiangensis]|uniref:Uncharacterized protein n=1 Tax=Saccharothrix xinjiangensis TaxID=204798 RepID=A0ABV9Y2J2_9PSEU